MDGIAHNIDIQDWSTVILLFAPTIILVSCAKNYINIIDKFQRLLGEPLLLPGQCLRRNKIDHLSQNYTSGFMIHVTYQLEKLQDLKEVCNISWSLK